ncbi:MAG: SufD family Fe-S cluster assembly protein [Patescibacteria group bacterium]|jgi:Fe-S cluster assembly protein SufD
MIIIDGSQSINKLAVKPNEQLEVLLLLKKACAITCSIILEVDSSVKFYSAILGGNVQCEVNINHVGAGSTSEHTGIFFGTKHDQFKLNYWNNHTAQHTSGKINIHGVLFDSAYCDFKGNIKIQQTALDTKASLDEHTLLLGDKARSDAVPQLDIHTNAVQASHSSGITKLDDEILYYCASRGLTPETAKQLIVRGWLAECITSPEVQNLVDKQLGYVEA